MFCLRSWIPILFFLTNASPIYLILFISATYFLNRPCVYCSLLLGILVVSLFDFNSNWFEPKYSSQHVSDMMLNASGTLPDYVVSGLSAVGAVTNSTLSNMVDTARGALSARSVVDTSAVNSTFAEWAKGILRKEWRIQCLDLVVRL